MTYTTHGLMTPADLADHQKLTDTGPHPYCLGHDEGPGDMLSYCTAEMDCSYVSTSDEAAGPLGRHPDCPGHYAEPEALAYCSVADHCPGDEWAAGWVQAYDLQMPAPSVRAAPMGARARLNSYLAQHPGRVSDRQRRRLVKKAGRNRDALVYRDDGMGHPPNRQGYREVVEIFAAPQPFDEEPY